MGNTLGAALHAKMKELASMAVLKCYIKYLVKNNMASSAESVKEKIGPLCSAALDRGELTQYSLESITSKIDKSALFLKTVDSNHARDKFLDMELVNGIIKTDCSLLAGEDAEIVSESKELFDRMIKLRNKIVSKYSDIFLGECQNFYNDYKNLFDPGFEKRVKEMTGNEGLEPHITL